MKKRQRLGQHFLSSQSVAKSIVSAADITKNDVVLEIGTGKGILIPLLCKRAKKVISIESDKELFQIAKAKFSHIPNLTLKQGDGFKTGNSFSVFVSNLPYSQSRKAIEWLIQKKFSHAIVMVQKEFAQKLFQKGKERKSISVLANYAVYIEKIMDVNKNNFVPIPKVDSSILKFTRKKTVSKVLIRNVNTLFSYRRKTLQNILKQVGKHLESGKRIDELTGEEIIKIAKQINQK